MGAYLWDGKVYMVGRDKILPQSQTQIRGGKTMLVYRYMFNITCKSTTMMMNEIEMHAIVRLYLMPSMNVERPCYISKAKLQLVDNLYPNRILYL